MNTSSVLLFLVVDGLLVLTPGPDWLYVIARSLDGRRVGRGGAGGAGAGGAAERSPSAVRQAGAIRSAGRTVGLGLVAVAGICTAYVVYTLLTATGLAAAVAAVPGVLPVLRYAGAAYLGLLAVMMLRTAWRAVRHEGAPQAAGSDEHPQAAGPDEGHPHPAGSDQGHPQAADSDQGHPQAAGSDEGHPHADRAAKVFRQSMLTGLLNPKALLLFLSLLPQFADQRAAFPVGVQLALLGLLHVLACAIGYGAVALAAGRIGRRVARSSWASRLLPVVSAVLLLAVAAVTVL